MAKKRGFAAMKKSEVSKIAAEGGRKSHGGGRKKTTDLPDMAG